MHTQTHNIVQGATDTVASRPAQSPHRFFVGSDRRSVLQALHDTYQMGFFPDYQLHHPGLDSRLTCLVLPSSRRIAASDFLHVSLSLIHRSGDSRLPVSSGRMSLG